MRKGQFGHIEADGLYTETLFDELCRLASTGMSEQLAEKAFLTILLSNIRNKQKLYFSHNCE